MSNPVTSVQVTIIKDTMIAGVHVKKGAKVTVTPADYEALLAAHKIDSIDDEKEKEKETKSRDK